MNLQATLLIIFLTGIYATKEFSPQSGSELKGAVDSCVESSFVFVLIPADTQQELQELTWKGGDSFNQHGLTEYANKHFGKEEGDPIDVTSLDMPRKATGYLGITMYSDVSASEPENVHRKKLNERASMLAIACGHSTMSVYGDAFVTRTFNNKGFPGELRSISKDEVNKDAKWVPDAADHHYENVKQDLNLAALPSEKQGPVTWRQTQEDLEVSIDLPDGVKARDISLTMKYNLIKFGLKNGHAMPEEAPTEDKSPTLLQRLTSGMKLFASIDTDLSTWTVSEGQLVMSLTKKEAKKWKTVFPYGT